MTTRFKLAAAGGLLVVAGFAFDNLRIVIIGVVLVVVGVLWTWWQYRP
jgi:hypothetical protein